MSDSALARRRPAFRRLLVPLLLIGTLVPLGASVPLYARTFPLDAVGTATPPNGQSKIFALEIIVFRELDPSAGRHEIWPTHLPTNAPFRRALTLEGSRAYLFHVRALPPARYALDGVWKTLVIAAPYHPVLHTGWILPGLPIAVAPYLAFSASDGSSGRVVGAVRLSLNRYLHAAVDAYWVGPPPAGSSESCPKSGCVYPLVEALKIRPNRLVYFDNPRFGVLLEARVMPRRSGRTRG